MKWEAANSHEVAVSLTPPHTYCNHWGSLVFLYFPRCCPEQVQPGSYRDLWLLGIPLPPTWVSALKCGLLAISPLPPPQCTLKTHLADIIEAAMA